MVGYYYRGYRVWVRVRAIIIVRVGVRVRVRVGIRGTARVRG